MKKILFTLLFLFVAFNVRSQPNYINVCDDCSFYINTFNFDNPSDSSQHYITIDTTLTDNLWQFGVPNKIYFTPSVNNISLVTDTVNPYSVSNISTFQMSFINCNYLILDNNCEGSYGGLRFYIHHTIDTDSGIDGGTIEISHDNGTTWNNIISDTLIMIANHILPTNLYTINDTVASLGQPGFSGQGDLYSQFQIYQDIPSVMYDTLIMRFTFASDSIQTNKDGWMINTIQLNNDFEEINEMQNDQLVTLYPNPVADYVSLIAPESSTNQTVSIINTTGQQLYYNKNYVGESIETNRLPNGIYLLKYSNGVYFANKRFVVQH